MKTAQKLVLSVALLVSVFTVQAITNTAIAVSGTNIVLSWPSHGYESYLVQYRQTLNLTDSWSVLTNAYPANGTNKTTFTIHGLITPPGTNGSNGGDGGGSPPSPDQAASEPSEPMVMPADGSGTAAPLAIYPVGFNLSGFIIFDPATGQWVSGNGYVVNPTPSTLSGGFQPMDDDSSTNVNTGFFRVFHIPDWLVSFSGYTFNGPTFIPVDYASPDAPTNYIDSTTVLINGQPTDAAVFTSDDIDGTTYWGMGIYFDRLPNGTNTIQLLTTVRQSDELSDQTPYMVFSNAPQTIVIGNTISFTNWDDLIWNNTNCIFTAQSSVPNVDWEIDIYDVYGEFVNYQTGHSDDGNISWTWDLVDYLGNPRNNPDSDPVFYPYFFVSQVSGNASGQIQANGASDEGPGPSKAASFPGTGAWLVAYMDNFYLDAGGVYAGEDAYYKAIMNGLAGGPELWNIPANAYPLKFGTNYTQADRDSSWDGLRQLLANPQYRNFYYHGHGGMDSIGGDVTTFDATGFPAGSKNLSGSKAGLTSKYVRDNVTLHNPLGVCFYRFVWLDGCATEFGDWPDTWGIGKVTNNLDYYRSSANTYHMRPSAFVGWHTTVGGQGWGTSDNAIGYRSEWMGNWSVENGQLTDGLSDIFSFTTQNGPGQWPPGGTSQLWGNLRVYGYRNIKFNEYNRQGDWP